MQMENISSGLSGDGKGSSSPPCVFLSMTSAFVSGAALPIRTVLPCKNVSHRPRTVVSMTQGDGKTRRSFMRDICSVAFLAFARVPESLAAVSFDTDRFGDKGKYPKVVKACIIDY